MFNHSLPYLFTVLTVLFVSSLLGQNGLPPTAANRGMAMGGTGVTFTDAHAVWTNPAGLGALNEIGVNLAAERRFGLDELQQASIGFAIPTNFGGFGLSISSFGYSSLRESRIGLSYGRALAENFRIGAEFVGLNTGIAGFDSRFSTTFSLGMQIDLLPELTVGFRAFSPVRIEVVEAEFLPQLFTLGIAYQPNKKLNLLAEVDQDLEVETRLRFGLEYFLSEELTARLGISSGPAELSFGIGYGVTETLRLQAAARYHEILGISPGFGLTYTASDSK